MPAAAGTFAGVGTGYDIALLLHLLCAIGGFGYLAYNGLTITLGRRRGAALSTLQVTQQVSGLAEIAVYGAFIFGVVAVGASSEWSFTQAWVPVSMVLYLAAIGLLHGVIRKGQREYSALAGVLASSSGPIPASAPELRRIESLERRITLGWGAFNVLTVAVVALMVFRPGA